MDHERKTRLNPAVDEWFNISFEKQLYSSKSIG
jgi:hypothetical protein